MTSAMVVMLGVALVTGAQAQVPFWGSCPEQIVEQNFQPAMYVGKWYEQEKYYSVYEVGAKCITATFTDSSDGSLTVLNSKVNRVGPERPTLVSGKVTPSSSNGDGNLTVSIPNTIGGATRSKYWILDTDYTSYSIVWSCSRVLGYVNYQFLWVLTRARTPEAAVLATARGVIASRYLSTAVLLRTTQDCDN